MRIENELRVNDWTGFIRFEFGLRSRGWWYRPLNYERVKNYGQSGAMYFFSLGPIYFFWG